MKTLTLVCLLGGLVLWQNADDEAKKDLDKMQGEWNAAQMKRDGTDFPADDANAYFRSVKGDAYTIHRFRRLAGKGSFKLDAGKNPRHIDASPAMPPGAKTVLGIYAWDGDKLKMCMAPPGAPRPTDFEAKEGSNHSFTLWEREKK